MYYSDTQHQEVETALSGFIMNCLNSLRMRAPYHVIPVAAIHDRSLFSECASYVYDIRHKQWTVLFTESKVYQDSCTPGLETMNDSRKT